MSHKNKKDEISLGTIIFLLLVFPPAGFVLLAVKYVLPILASIFSGTDDPFARKNRYSGYEKRDGEKIFAEFWDADGGKTEETAKESTGPEAEPMAGKPGKLPHRVSSIVFLVLGALFLFTGISGGISDFLSYGPAVLLEDLAAYLLCIGLGGAFGFVGLKFRRKLKLAKKYISVIGERGRVTIDELASSLSQPKKKVLKDLQSVIDSGIFGEYAYIDMGRQMFLRNSSFAPPEEKKDETKARSADYESDIDDYERTLRRIRRLNDEIVDVPVSDRIDRIEEYTRRIFEFLKKNPERERDVHTFMTYYLPTTLKLLESYSEIERVGVAGDNMRSAKENIEKTLDLLVEAYKRLLDQLYESENMDISSDIDVLEKMMQKDGLTGKEFGMN